MDIAELTEDANNIMELSKVSRDDNSVVDFSNEGLTVVPVTLFKRRNITKLDLSDNNIRNIPIDIANLINLKHLNLSRNGFRCTHSDDQSTIPKEMRKIHCLEYLNISECNLSFIPASIWDLVSLVSLDISRNKINILPPDVGNLDNLKWLNAQHTGLTTVPEEIVGCANLETLLLYGNKITTLPHILAEVPNLTCLSVNLRHMADKIDADMEALLYSGQIKSDHIPSTIFTLPRLEKIELEFCKMNFVHNFRAQPLTELLLSGNMFRDIPDCLFDLQELRVLSLEGNLLKHIGDSVQKLANLRILLLSKNSLESVSCFLFQMTSLEVLDLSSNCLTQISIPDTIRNQTLKSLNISFNKICILPDNIILLESLEDLELSDNYIKELPIDLCSMKNITEIHQYNGLYKVGLWLLNNPIIFPPSTIWNTTDISNMYTFLEKTKIQRINKRDPVRIVLLGDNNLQKLTFLGKFLNKTLPGDFHFLSIDTWTSANKVPFVLINVDSNRIYSMLWRNFIDDNSLVWLFVNVEDENCLAQCNKWIGAVSDSATNCVIQIIVEKNYAPLEKNEDFEADFVGNIVKEMTDQYRDCKLRILPDVFVVEDDGDLTAMNQYKSRLEYLAIDRDVFHEDENFDILKEKAASIEKISKSKKVTYLNLDTLVGVIKCSLNVEEEEIYLCLAILHKRGRIFWFQRNMRTRARIYPFIFIFLRSTTSLLKTNYADDMNFEENALLRADALLIKETVLEMENNFYNFGEISLPLYNVLTFNLSKSLALKDFLIDAQMAWSVPIPAVPKTDSSTRPYLVFPNFNKVPVNMGYLLTDVLLKDQQVRSTFAVTVDHLSSTNCDDIFTHLLCAINCWASTRFDWSNLCYTIHDDGDFILFMRSRDETSMTVEVVSRSWCDGDDGFRNWLFEWYEEEFKTRLKSTYKMTEKKVDDMESCIRNYM